jgi:hypothetical protein
LQAPLEPGALSEAEDETTPSPWRTTDEMKRHVVLLCVLFLAAALSGCMAEAAPPPAEAERAASGFFMGLWHGMILFFSFIFSLFDDTVAVYDVVNTGHLYDLGFLLGAGGTVAVVEGTRRSRVSRSPRS